MAKKKKHEEHENLERWLVSYADFITLLFATFVVLYALSQSDVAQFDRLQESIRSAFTNSGPMEGSDGMFDMSSSLFDASATGPDANPLMLEYLSQKYEEEAFNQIRDDVEKLNQDGLDVKIEERGLVIKASDKLISFDSGSAKITPQSEELLSKIADIIFSRFQIHFIKVEGHTDSAPTSSTSIYPTNWELSSARASSVITYFTRKHKLSPKLFVALGYADTIPLPNSVKNPSINRRVEIVVTRNKYKIAENNDIKSLFEVKKKQPQSKYIKHGTTPKRDVENVLEDKELVSPTNSNPTGETKVIKRVYENESTRLNTPDGKQDAETLPDFLR